MQVEWIREPGREWDEFVEAQGAVCLGHAAAWSRIVQRAYGLESLYLVARGPSGSLRGVLPLVQFRGISGGRSLVSLPYLDTAGVLAEDDETERALLDRARALVAERGATSLEIRNARPLATIAGVGEQDRVNLVLPLEPDEESQWKSLRAKVRNQTRKATREGLVLSEAGRESRLEGFYAAFCENMRDLGSPVHSRRFFEAIADEFGERLRFHVVESESRPVGGLVAIRFGSSVSIPWASTLRSERKKCPNNLIYWEAIRWAVEGGASELDFGRSAPGAGTHRFKLGWGAEERPLGWMRFDREGQVVPAQLVSGSPMLQRISDVWTRLPLAWANALGPRLRKYFSN